MFDILGARVANARLVDLYAGSGAVGLEAVSRGAARAVLVEPEAAALRRNVSLVAGGDSVVEVLAVPAESALPVLEGRGERFDLIFADPPYERAIAPGVASAISRLLAPAGLFVFQTDTDTRFPELPGLRRIERRAYGRNVFLFFESTAAGF